MKKKYFFVIFFLILVIFFIINITSVNAKMYKILDSEGNVIRLTSDPVLSIKEKEAGYTISPPPEESIKPTQDQMKNKQEIKQEISSGSEKYDLRKVKWGMKKEEVKAAERGKIVLETEDEVDVMVPDFDDDFQLGYMFLEDKLYRSTYLFIGKFTNKNDYIDEFEKWKEALMKKYGKPTLDRVVWKNDLYKSDKQEWGMAVSVGHLLYAVQWETSTTEIGIMLMGNNYKINLGIFYESKKLKEWAKRIKEKEALKGL